MWNTCLHSNFHVKLGANSFVIVTSVHDSQMVTIKGPLKSCTYVPYFGNDIIMVEMYD